MRLLAFVLAAALPALVACASADPPAGVESDALADPNAGTTPAEPPGTPSPGSPSASTPACLPMNTCAPPAPPVVSKRDWRHSIASPAITLSGSPHHRGRDLFVNPGAPQTIIAKFAYGVSDKDLEDEEVDIFVQRDCATSWEKLGTAITLEDGAPHPTVEGVPANGGRLYFEIPSDKQLGPGRHRVRLVVAGDGSSTDLFIDVVPPQTPIFISDVDGTLTSSEYVEFTALLTGDLPDTHPGAPEALRELAAKGYRPIYVTARPEWLVQRTREFLDAHGFPPGVIHTSTSVTGAGVGSGAAEFKQGEMKMLADKGLVPAFGFGNKGSDSDAYAPIPIEKHRIFYKIDDAFTGRKIESYTELVPEFVQLPAMCNP